MNLVPTDKQLSLHVKWLNGESGGKMMDLKKNGITNIEDFGIKTTETDIWKNPTKWKLICNAEILSTLKG